MKAIQALIEKRIAKVLDLPRKTPDAYLITKKAG